MKKRAGLKEIYDLVDISNKINQVNWWNTVDKLELTYRRSVCFDSMIRQVDQRLARVEALLERMAKPKAARSGRR